MTKNKRSTWRAASRDLAATNRRTVTRVTGSIPSAPDAAERLAAVKAAAATRKHSKIGKITNMHEATRADLVARLQKLSADERADIMAEAAAEYTAEAGKTKAAEALSELVRPTRKD